MKTANAAEFLGVQHVVSLGFSDSGLDSADANGFASVPTELAASALLGALGERSLRPTAITVYDERGIYGHPDHVAVHQVGVAAAQLAGIPTIYEATVDREYLHFVETHVVVEAGLPERTPASAWWLLISESQQSSSTQLST